MLPPSPATQASNTRRLNHSDWITRLPLLQYGSNMVTGEDLVAAEAAKPERLSLLRCVCYKMLPPSLAIQVSNTYSLEHKEGITRLPLSQYGSNMVT